MLKKCAAYLKSAVFVFLYPKIRICGWVGEVVGCAVGVIGPSAVENWMDEPGSIRLAIATGKC